MKPERWQQIKGLLQAALERAPDERSDFLATACGGDESLRKEIQKLIVSHDQAGTFIEEPAFGVLAESLVGEAAEETLSGQRLGHYAIGRQLGKGGMGEVYLAEDTRLGRNVALKLLPAFFTTEVERVRRFQQEARAASALNHPNILTIYEIGEIDSRHFMATEFVEGVTLRQRLTNSRMEIVEIIEVAMQIASALLAAHDSGIIHRDVKPENIMLRRDGILKVLDFGLAKLLDRPSGSPDATEVLTTRSGTVMGTTHYMSPEQTRGLRVDERTDIWSFGVLLYEMTGLRVPFTGDTSSDVMVSILEKKPPPLARLQPETPAALHRVVNKALQKDRNRRYQNMRAVLTDLQKIKRSLIFAEAQRRSDQPSLTSRRERRASQKSRDRRLLDSIAVLPLVNAGGDAEMEYLSDGVTENIIDNISQLPSLRVMAWGTVARYRGLKAAPNEVGRALRVRTVLGGSLRFDGDRLIVRTELVDTTDGACLWSVRYDQNIADIFSMQEEIAREISQKLRLKLTGEDQLQLARRQTADVDAYHAYLKGRYYWNKRATEKLKKGADCFRQAIDLDPNYAAAYAGLSDSYTLLVVREAMPPEEGFAKAKAAAARALEIDEYFAQAHASLGHAMLHNWEWEEGEQELKRAIQLSPGYPSAHHWYSEHLTAMGRHDESIAELKLAAELDPLSLIISADLGRAFYYARQYDQVLKQEARTLEMDSNFWLSHINLGRAYLQTGSHSKAIRELQKACKLSEESTEALSFLGFAYAAADQKDEARRTLAELNDQSKHEHVPPYHLAIVHAGLGEKEKAFECLARAFEKHSVDLFTLNVEPMLDSLRRDPRFASLLQRTGLAPAETFSRVKGVLKSPVHQRPYRKAIRSLAIMPFVNACADPNMDYLSDGITESIINALSQLPKVRVVARNTVFRYKGREIDSEGVGRALSVQAVVTGRVQQVSGKLIIGAELVDVENDSQLWGENFKRNHSDVFEVQSEIANEIVDKLRLKLSGADKGRLAKRYTNNFEAYRAYLQGLYHWNKRTEGGLVKAIEHFTRAVKEDPNYALAYGSMANAYALLSWYSVSSPAASFPAANEAAQKALSLDDSIAEAHTALGFIRHSYDWDWQTAEKEFKRALEINPIYATGHQWYAVALSGWGRHREAVREIMRARELEPLSLVINRDVGWVLYWARRFDEAVESYLKTLELAPEFYIAHYFFGETYEQMGKRAEAIVEYHETRSHAQEGTEVWTRVAQARAYALAGRRVEAQKSLTDLIALSQNHYVSPYLIAVIQITLGEKESALQWLERAYEERDPYLAQLKVEPAVDALRSEPQFNMLLRRIGLESGSIGAPKSASLGRRMASTSPARNRKVISSVAVLPFANSSNDPNTEYLCDGITESIINSLSQLPKLRVVARSSAFRYKSSGSSLQEIGSALNVQTVLTGRVRQVAENLNIGAELIDLDGDRQLWGETYNRNLADIFEIQADIAKEIADKLRLKLTGKDKGRLTRRYTENAEAYQLYLMGRYHWNKRTVDRVQQGLECFQQAIAIDPTYALAYAGASDCFAVRGDVGLASVPSKDAFAAAKQAAQRALEIDNTLAEAYVSLAHANMHCFEWAEAEAAFKSAIRLNVNHAQTHEWYAFYLLFNAQPEKAIAEARRALELDPISVMAHEYLGQIFHYARQYDRAIELYGRALKFEPNRYRVYLWLGWTYEQKGMYEEAIEAFRRALSDDSTEPLASLGCVYALSGRTEDARDVLRQLEEFSSTRYVSPYQRSLLLLSLDEESKAFEWLENAYEQRAEWMIYLSVDPRFDRLRANPRFVDLVRRIDFRTS